MFSLYGKSKKWDVIGIVRCLYWVLAVVWCLVLVPPVSAFNFSAWDAMLKKYVTPGKISGIQLNTVAYRQMKRDPELMKLVTALKKFPLDQLKTREEKLSFWINVYNIMAVKMVLDHYPVESIKDAGSLFKQVWKKPVGVVAGKERTLNEIEHGILRRMNEPRIHVAIVCASISCPDLLQSAYSPKRLDSQLDGQLKRFLQNPGKGMRIDRENGRLYLSSIFKWFDDDFESMGGVLSFITKHSSPRDQKFIQSEKRTVDYLDYNWSLNGL